MLPGVSMGGGALALPIVLKALTLTPNTIAASGGAAPIGNKTAGSTLEAVGSAGSRGTSYVVGGSMYVYAPQGISPGDTEQFAIRERLAGAVNDGRVTSVIVQYT